MSEKTVAGSPEGLLARLQECEVEARKLHAKGDLWWSMGRKSSSSRYHAAASRFDASAQEFARQLTALWGPPGRIAEARSDPGPSEDPPQELEYEEWRELEDACFYARYPNWCERVPRLRAAFLAWRGRVEFAKLAPGYQPVLPAWKS